MGPTRKLTVRGLSAFMQPLVISVGGFMRLLIFSLVLSFPTWAFDESINYQPGINLYSEVAQMRDLWGTKGSELCAPNSLTNAFVYLKWQYQPKYSELASIPDEDGDGVEGSYRDYIRYFFDLCHTDREKGTLYRDALSCMKDYITLSGYTPWAFMLGPDSQEAPQGHVLGDVKRMLRISDVRYYTKARLPVIMMVGWYKFNGTGYERTGGHFFNVYGDDYDNAWGEEKIVLKVVNSAQDYTGRDRSQMYDDVTMARFNLWPGNPQVYELNGPGFNYTNYKALVEDILIMIPIAQ